MTTIQKFDIQIEEQDNTFYTCALQSFRLVAARQKDITCKQSV